MRISDWSSDVCSSDLIGDTNFPDHVALRSGEHFVDIRGILDEASFLAHHTGMSIVPISRQDVEFHCGLSGMSPPYRGVRQIAEARKAVRRTFPEGVTLPAETPATDNPEDRIGGQDWSVCIRP